MESMTEKWKQNCDGSYGKTLAVEGRSGGTEEIMARSTLNKKYQALFEKFNHQYFANALPQYQIKVVNRLTGCNVAGLIDRKKKVISLRKGEHREMDSILIHEMAHASTNDYHGPKFINDMKRLHADGAPVREDELNQHPSYSKLLTKQFVKATAFDMLVDIPDLTLRRFGRLFELEYGAGYKSTELFRKYPWVKKAFSEAKFEYQELMKAEAAFKKTIREK